MCVCICIYVVYYYYYYLQVQWDPEIEPPGTKNWVDFLEKARQMHSRSPQKRGKSLKPSLQANDRFNHFYSDDEMSLGASFEEKIESPNVENFGLQWESHTGSPRQVNGDKRSRFVVKSAPVSAARESGDTSVET